MKTPKREDSSRRLEIVCYAAALFLAIGSIVGAWSLHIVATLILLATLYGVFRDVRALSRLRAQDEPARLSGRMIPLERSLPNARPPQQPPGPPDLPACSRRGE